MTSIPQSRQAKHKKKSVAVVCYNKGVTICFRGVLAQLARALQWH